MDTHTATCVRRQLSVWQMGKDIEDLTLAFILWLMIPSYLQENTSCMCQFSDSLQHCFCRCNSQVLISPFPIFQVRCSMPKRRLGRPEGFWFQSSGFCYEKTPPLKPSLKKFACSFLVLICFAYRIRPMETSSLPTRLKSSFCSTF